MSEMTHSLRLAENGRLVVPLELRRAAGLENGGPIMARIENGQIILESIGTAVTRAQAMARRYGDPNRSLADELIAERRAEAVDD
jgi:antitoxin PrlF